MRSSVEPTALAEAIKTQVHAVDPGVPLSHVRTLAEATSLWMAPRVLNLSPRRLVGSYFPARRAMRVDPLLALRHE